MLAAAPFRFLPDEVEQMEARLQPLRNPSPDRVAMEELARKFSASAERIGKVVIQPKQVRTCSGSPRTPRRSICRFGSNSGSRMSEFRNPIRYFTQIWVLALQVRTWFCNRRYYSREGKAAKAAQAQGNLAARTNRQLAAGSSAAVHAGSSSGGHF